ncbi:hypothetical protein NXS98_16595 [Fontisphaera persica]|uniref:hypothetical protein n=1 Tax=Fontisphaera persica TaxID=2974023 RepID=UPI0024BF8F2B|nr:hypothetical protein [Fontisphaera persica]WCJ59317.1 hypothetical protein NXS98_16595 [Fontisphaera persica]
MKTTLRTVLGQPSWRMASSHVELFVTQTGGHLGPVTFDLGGRKVQPYHVAPWAQEKGWANLPPILRVLRGDFFCLPFGANSTPWRGEQHPVHGETANARWKCLALVNDAGTHCLHLQLRTQTRPGLVDKVLFLREDHTAIYCRHVLSGFSGPMNFGHHAMLRFPDTEGAGLISTSRFVWGQVFPQPFEDPAQGGYQSLKPAARFDSLARVPRLDGTLADLTAYPARPGFEDLVLMVSDPKLPFAWTAVTFPQQGYVWFALKDPRVLRQTIFWLSNGGRHYPPWNGRHRHVMGLEDVTSYFHLGLAQSASPNPLSRAGHPTVENLTPEMPLIIPYIMGVAPIPKGFDRVKNIERVRGGIRLTAANGKTARAPVAMEFLD